MPTGRMMAARADVPDSASARLVSVTTGGPVPSSAYVSARMRRQLRRDTLPEMAVRRVLYSAGYRYRLGWPVPGMRRRSIDIAFPGSKVALFVDGCFWHQCRQHRTDPRSNSAWWARKLARNVERDRETDSLLRDQGWAVVRVWEHEPPEVALTRVRQVFQDLSAVDP